MKKLSFDCTLYDKNSIMSHNSLILNKLPIRMVEKELYVEVLSYFPFSETKQKVYSKLENKKQRIGMLNRYILGVARKLEISQILIKQAQESTKSYYGLKNGDDYDVDWIIYINRTRIKLGDNYELLLKLILEEINKQKNIKYLRKKKMEKIIDNKS